MNHLCNRDLMMYGTREDCPHCQQRGAEIAALKAERDRLRKLFDDAGQGEHNVLALIDHYQDEAIAARRQVDRLRRALENLLECHENEPERPSVQVARAALDGK